MTPDAEIDDHIGWKVVVNFHDATLPSIHLRELISLMRRKGFWLNPNLRPEFPHLRGDFTNFLHQLARCPMLVQCNPDKTSEEVHRGMGWPGSGSARVLNVQNVNIVGGESFLDKTSNRQARWWQCLRTIIAETVEVKPDQRWICFYRTTISFDGRNERKLQVVHLGCHALTACAFFFAPNRLVPERVVGHSGDIS